jgi:outer membrane protein TolC
MVRLRLRSFPSLLSRRRLAAVAGLPLLALGCANPAPGPAALPDPAIARGAEPADTLPPPQPVPPATLPEPNPPAAPAEAPPKKVLPVSLDTVFRLAQDQNLQVQKAREQVNGANAQLDVAQLGWLPQVYVGPSWYRHEGGIQNEDGTLTHSSFGAIFAGLELNGELDLRQYAFEKVKAERDVWQQKGELSRITTETLQEASDTYLDLLHARSEELLARQEIGRQEELLQFVRGLDERPTAEVATVEADLEGYRQLAQHMVQLQHAASARLVYLLGLDPCTELIPVDDHLQAFELIDANVPACDLVARALAAGPGIRELEGMLGLLQNAIAQANGPSRLLPTFGVRMAEGAFGAGPGANLAWDNRWDLNLQARWDLTGLVTAKASQHAAESKLQQTRLSLQDLRGKLASGVEASRDEVLRSREQLELARRRIASSLDAYRINNSVRKEPEDKKPIIRELVQNIRMLREAEHEYLETLSAYDKAQVRLILLLGPTAPPPPGVAPCR